MAVYAREMAEDNSTQISRLRHNLVRALQQEVTSRQRQYLLLYYGRQINMTEIGRQLGVDKSTVSRTIKRGEERLRRCLRFGAANLLEEDSI
jgi:RNA polymerase sigma factor (sigma-70 family)